MNDYNRHGAYRWAVTYQWKNMFGELHVDSETVWADTAIEAATKMQNTMNAVGMSDCVISNINICADITH